MTPKLIANNRQDTTIQTGCSFYFASRCNNSNWNCNFIHPFLLNLSNGVTTGQFVSTLWFNEQVNKGDTFDFVVMRLPRRDCVFHRDEIKTKDIIVEDLLNAERNQTPFRDLKYVVIHKRYMPHEIQNIIHTVTTKIINDKRVNHAKHQDNVRISNKKSFGLSFDGLSRAIRTKTTSESHLNQRIAYPAKLMRRNTSNGYVINNDYDIKNDNNICVYVSCPTFEIKNMDE